MKFLKKTRFESGGFFISKWAIAFVSCFKKNFTEMLQSIGMVRECNASVRNDFITQKNVQLLPNYDVRSNCEEHYNSAKTSDKSGMNCDKSGMNCDKSGMNCDKNGMKCVKNGKKCVKNGMKFDKSEIKCDKSEMKCYKSEMKCYKSAMR